MIKVLQNIIISAFVLVLVQCQPTEKPKASANSKDEQAKLHIKVPSFNRDSAFYNVEKQLEFGPRRPNTDAHIACKNWLINTFDRHGLHVSVQEFNATTYFDEKMKGFNIIAQYKPELEKRLMISAHWDTRFQAEKEQNEVLKKEPILGADDGGSGVAVIMEMARLLADQNIPIGVDFVLFDLEDQGESSSMDVNSWCLGSQYWAKNPHISKFKFGINLDMVGSKGAVFKQEAYSLRYAPGIVSKVWQWGKRLGYGHYFSDARVGGITDDHYFVNLSGVGPMINIIYTTREYGGTFGSHWHTHDDDLDVIDRNVMKAVGQVVLNVIFKEAEGRL